MRGRGPELGDSISELKPSVARFRITSFGRYEPILPAVRPRAVDGVRERWVPVNPAICSYPVLTSDQINQDYDVLIFGDAAAPFASP